MTTTALRTVLIEDERLAREELKRYLAPLAQIDLVGEAASFASAQALLREARPQLVFLDVQLDGGSGLDLLAAGPPDLQAIVVSAHEGHALRAFEERAIDYLLKPVQPQRLHAALARLSSPGQPQGLSPPTDTGTRPLDYDDHVFLSLGEDDSLFLAVSSIRAVLADGDHTRVQTSDGRHLRVPRPLRHWEARLPTQAFARIHRGTIVNLRCIRAIDRWFNRRFRVHVDGLPRPLMMSRRYAESLRARLG